jgi:hypothetical protein
LRYWGKPILIDIYFDEVDICTSSARCLGFGAVYRISFTLFVFFLLHALFMLCRGGMDCHTSWWWIKLTGLLGLLAVCFFALPNSVLDVYAAIARFVSAVFLLVQLVILVDFAYNLNDRLMQDEKERHVTYLFLCVALYGGAVTLIAFSFINFTENGECHRNKFFVGFSIVLMIIATGLGVWEKVVEKTQKGGLLPTGVVSLYCMYLLYSALRSDPSACNSQSLDGSPSELVISILIACFTVTWAAWSLTNSKTIFGDEEDHEASPLAGDDAKPDTPEAPAARGAVKMEEAGAGSAAGSDPAPKPASDEEQELQAKRNFRFHGIMAVASMYMAMLLTNFGVETDSSGQAYDLSDETVYIKMATQWATFLLYIWTLVAPLVCPDRDFS